MARRRGRARLLEVEQEVPARRPLSFHEHDPAREAEAAASGDAARDVEHPVELLLVELRSQLLDHARDAGAVFARRRERLHAVHANAAAPTFLLRALAEQRPALSPAHGVEQFARLSGRRLALHPPRLAGRERTVEGVEIEIREGGRVARAHTQLWRADEPARDEARQ